VFYKALATLGLLLLLVGWSQRRKRSVHVPLVASGMAIDLALVLILEFGRGVVEMTFEKEWSVAQWTHISTSTLAVLVYFPVIWYGVRLLRGTATPAMRVLHRRTANLALTLRTIGFAFMWFV
jgi:hypothetical protein